MLLHQIKLKIGQLLTNKIVLCIFLILLIYLFIDLNSYLNKFKYNLKASYNTKFSIEINGGILPNSNATGGTCSQEAFQVGYHQKVLAYSLYNARPIYYKGFDSILKNITILYPGWYARIYTDTPKIEVLLNLKQKYKNLHICDALHLPPPNTTAKKIPGMIWRFFPLLDPQVDVVLIRDSDSKVSIIRDTRNFIIN